jgi:hypothetical protein
MLRSLLVAATLGLLGCRCCLHRLGGLLQQALHV